MKKKKVRSKQPRRKTENRRWHQAHLRLISPFLALIIQSGCITTSTSNQSTIKYANPPAVGSWLQSQRELVACETVSAARFMADFGFFHPQCKQLAEIGPREYQVQSRTKVQLREGPMWLLQVQQLPSTLYWVPIPWHDWL